MKTLKLNSDPYIKDLFLALFFLKNIFDESQTSLTLAAILATSQDQLAPAN